MWRIFLFLLGVFICSLSLSCIILYLNLITMGYTFWQYVKFIIRSFSCNSFLLGVLCIYLSIKRWGKHELFLRSIN